ncbi:MAG: 2'-deoxycytidine 5'-triphosphate deaminase, partial [Candidatus Aenigmatarchaeota archaeon]
LYDDGRIWSESGPVIGTSEMDLTVSKNVKETIIIESGCTASVELGQRITGKLPHLGQVYIEGQGRSSSAKAGADIKIVGEDGPLQPGYRGSLYAEITSRANYPNGVAPGDRIADFMFYVGHPEECILDPLDVLDDTRSLVKNRNIEIDGKKLIMRLGLMNGKKPVGYKAKGASETAWLRYKTNCRDDFFESIESCSEYHAKKGDFLLLIPSTELCVDPRADVPFIARMLRYNRKGLEVNLKDTIRFGSRYHRTVMEVPVTEDTVLRHGDPICEIVFYRMYERPKTTYSGMGSRNNSTITGNFFY